MPANTIVLMAEERLGIHFVNLLLEKLQRQGQNIYINMGMCVGIHMCICVIQVITILYVCRYTYVYMCNKSHNQKSNLYFGILIGNLPYYMRTMRTNRPTHTGQPQTYPSRHWTYPRVRGRTLVRMAEL